MSRRGCSLVLSVNLKHHQVGLLTIANVKVYWKGTWHCQGFLLTGERAGEWIPACWCTWCPRISAKSLSWSKSSKSLRWWSRKLWWKLFIEILVVRMMCREYDEDDDIDDDNKDEYGDEENECWWSLHHEDPPWESHVAEKKRSRGSKRRWSRPDAWRGV